MKCIINVDGIIKRMSNERALKLVDNKSWTYCSKREWKENTKNKKK